METKRKCSSCGEEKILEKDFYKDRKQSGGYKYCCKLCSKEKSRISHQKNYEKNLETHNKWIANNEDRWKKYVKEYNAVYRKTPKGIQKHKTANQKYAHTERGRIIINLKTARRRKREAHLINDITADQVLQILKEQNRKCKICDKPFTKERRYELDHIVPVVESKPGDPGLTMGNVQLLCRTCNATKNKRSVI